MERCISDQEISEMEIKREDRRPVGLKNQRKQKKRDRRIGINSCIDPKFDRRSYDRRVSDK